MIDQDSVDVDISFVNDEAVFSYWKGHENFRKELFELSNMKDIEKIHSFAEHLIWGHCEEPWMRKTLARQAKLGETCSMKGGCSVKKSTYR